ERCRVRVSDPRLQRIGPDRQAVPHDAAPVDDREPAAVELHAVAMRCGHPLNIPKPAFRQMDASHRHLIVSRGEYSRCRWSIEIAVVDTAPEDRPDCSEVARIP